MTAPAPSSDLDAAALAGSLRADISAVWRIAWPTVLTMTSYTVMQFADRLMLGQVGPLEVAAAGNAGVWCWTVISVVAGVLTMVNTFVSQHLGAGRPAEGVRYAWTALYMAVATWIVVCVPLAFVLPAIFARIHTPDRVQEAVRLVAMESGYAQILLLGAITTLAARTIHNFFFGLHRPHVVTLASIAGNIVNIALNYVLIFGADGIPRLGLPGVPGVAPMGPIGAAIATVVGTTVEFLIPFAVFLGPKLRHELGTWTNRAYSAHAARDLLRTGWPSAIQYGNELVCWAIFMTGLVGWFGANHMAAGWITLGYMHLSFMPAVGFSTATTSLVGKSIGAGRPDLAVRLARVGVGMALVYMTCCGACFIVFRHPLVQLFVPGDVADPETIDQIVRIGGRLLICAAIFQAFDAMAIVYSGALRGAGDTVWPGIVTTIFSWLFIVGGGVALVAFAPALESLGPWIASATYIIALGIIMARRFESGRWRSIRLVETPVPAAAAI